jgi:C4-dicarboxylate transporter DctM subunit
MAYFIIALSVIIFFSGVPLFVVFGIATLLSLWLIPPVPMSFEIMVQQMFNTADSFPLMAVPFFILAGNIMTNGAIAKKLINIAKEFVGWIPGGMAIASVLACTFFAALSGSAAATLVAIGTIMYPALQKEKYREWFSLGIVTSASILGPIIPPSVPMIIYAIVAGVSVSDLFLAGVGPGILISIILIVFTLLFEIGSQRVRHKFVLKQAFKSLLSGFWALMLPVIILGGIYGGLFTVTEAASVALVYAFFVEVFIHKELRVRDIYRIFSQAAVDMGVLLVIIAVAIGLSYFLTIQRVPYIISDYIQAEVQSKMGFLLILNLLLLVVGCIMDTISAILVMAPLMVPIARQFNVEPIQLGIIFVINLSIGMLTPPIGTNIFVASSIFKKSFGEVVKSIAPFILLLLAALAVITYFPALSLYFVNFVKMH